MTPAHSPPDQLAPLTDSLIAAFEALLATARSQLETEALLRKRLEFAADEYEKLLAADGSRSSTSNAPPPSLIAKQIRQVPPAIPPVEQSLPIQRAQRALRSYNMSAAPMAPRTGAQCPVKHAPADPEDLEHDFTTPGVQGRLGCPFAKMSHGFGPTPEGPEDPIAAEFHYDKSSSRSANADQRPGQCPIRFLDQHSPEEIAEYFENHKHEIPRSHEICVRRYQQNELGARQMDAKYGSLANMIQGLGVKHKAYLPERDRADDRDKSSSGAVEKWATTVSEHPSAVPQPPVGPEDDTRRSHFERPLREVRVGESPSRPWGISVPAGKEPAPSALQSDHGAAHLHNRSASSREAATAESGDRPAGRHSPTRPRARSALDREAKSIIYNGPVFNGPVFFGYSADQMTAWLQNPKWLDAMKASTE